MHTLQYVFQRGLVLGEVGKLSDNFQLSFLVPVFLHARAAEKVTVREATSKVIRRVEDEVIFGGTVAPMNAIVSPKLMPSRSRRCVKPALS